jgi:dTDP-glucose pyrophosphorylase/CBS domain-containing protein
MDRLVNPATGTLLSPTTREDDGVDRPADLPVVPVDATIREAMQVIDQGACELALAVDDTGRLLGTITDGDVRRAILAGRDLDDPVKPHVNASPLVVGPDEPRPAVIDLMQSHLVSQIPMVDDDGRLVGLHLLRHLVGRVSRPNLAVVMAGGRGARLGPLTDDLPKPMLRVAGRPILERIILHLVGSGLTTIALSVNYLAERIEEHFGDGSSLGCRIVYLREDPEAPLGTAGSLSLLADTDLGLDHPVLVMNGDLVTEFDVASLLDAHESSDAVATVAGRRYNHQVPFGVLQTGPDDLVEGLVEKPVAEWWANAGIYVLDPDVVGRVPTDEPSDLPRLLAGEIRAGRRVGLWRLVDDWHDVGRPDDLRHARGVT